MIDFWQFELFNNGHALQMAILNTAENQYITHFFLNKYIFLKQDIEKQHFVIYNLKIYKLLPLI